MQTETIWIVLAAILVLVELWAINKVRKAQGKSSNKLVWMVLIVFVPLFGLLACHWRDRNTPITTRIHRRPDNEVGCCAVRIRELRELKQQSPEDSGLFRF